MEKSERMERGCKIKYENVPESSGGSLVEPAERGDNRIAKWAGGVGQLEQGSAVGGVAKVAKGGDGPQAQIGG